MNDFERLTKLAGNTLDKVGDIAKGPISIGTLDAFVFSCPISCKEGLFALA